MTRKTRWTFVATLAAATLSVSTQSFAQSCGDPGAGDCCTANGSAFCNDATCCEAVCAFDAFCCTVEWDGICASEAATVCEVCGAGSCTVDCAKATVEEGELCGDDINGGCNNPSFAVSFIDLGDIVCGDYWADGSTRDTDWYEFTLAENRVVDVRVTGEILTNVFITTADCPASLLATGIGVGGVCDVAIEDKCLLAGTYRVVVVPATFNGFPCGIEGGKKYSLSLIDTGETCTGPENDSCTGAIEITDPSSTAFDSTLAFTDGDSLPAECDSFGSVTIFNDLWYKFTAASSSLYEISTCDQADFDTRLAIYSGGCDNLSLLACNDDGDGCGAFTSKILTSLDAGTEYWVRVGGFGEGGGTGTLSVQAVQGCDVTCPPNAYVEKEACGEDSNGGCNTVPASNCCSANGGVGCDDPTCQDAVCSFDSFCCSVAWDAICAGEAASLCPELCAPVEPLFENIEVGQTVCGTFWAANSTRDTDWYKINLASDATVTLTANSTLNVTIGILSGDCPPRIYAIDATQSCGATLSACLPAGESTIFIALANFTFPACGNDPLNNYTFTTSLGSSCTPLNDECAGATPIADGETTFTTEGATTSAPDLDPSCDKGFGTAFVRDIWFTYTATCTGTANFSTCGTVDYDSRLALYSGTCDNLSIVACNDDGPGCPGFSSSMDADVVEGQTYFLRVGGFAAAGSGTISINCGGGGGGPSNDECDNASPISVGPTAFSTIGATGATQMDPGACTFFSSSIIYNDVWFSYTATGDGDVTIETCNAANFDTRIAVFSDCSLGTTIACNDDASGCGLTSRVTFAAVCGTTYKVSVGAYSQTGFGTGTVTLTQVGTCPSPCFGELTGDNAVDAADLGVLLGAWGNAGGPADLNNNGTVGPEDLALLLGAWGNCD
ncbi:MAG: hypothetical protein JNM94_06140 [Phycisphaerae bacterium]|nr:hypothetical protein [Phycisphaerae bacterium]